MTKKINFDTSLGRFVAIYPQSKNIFKNYELDYCCGGEKDIALAVKEKNIDWEEFKTSLQKIIDETPESEEIKIWTDESLTNIINHIEQKHHKALWEDLESIDKLLDKLIFVHVKKHGDFLIGLKSVFSELREKLELHLLSEENSVFNYVKELESSIATNSEKPAEEKFFTKELIELLQNDHEEVRGLLGRIRTLTSNYKLPNDVCTSFETLYEDLESMEDDLHEHIHLENTVLFPKLKKLIEQK